MNRTKLIELLKTFSPAEFNEFGKFIYSPLHNESRMMMRLYDLLKKYHPSFSSNRFTKEKIYKELYEDSEYEDKKLRDRFSDMNKLAEDFLSWMNYRINPIEIKRHTLLQFSNRRLEINFNKKFREIQDALDKVKIKNEDYFFYRHELINSKIDFYETKELSGKRKPFYDDLASEIDQFTLFFITKMLSYYVMMYNRELTLKYDFEYKLYEPIMKLVEEYKFDNYPTIRSHYLLLKLIRDRDNESIYYELKEYLIKCADQIIMVDKKIIFTELFNIALDRYYKERPGFEKESFEILKLQLEHETYPVEIDGWIDLGFYFSYVILSISIVSPESCEKFIHEYSDKLNPLKKENGSLFVKGILHYAQKKYDLALKDLSRIKGGDLHYYIRIKSLLSKIYFEQKDYENVLILIDSFKHYLSSNPMIPKHLNLKYTNYINMLRKLTLLTLSLDKDEYNIYKLENEINNFSIEELTSHKSWLLERVKELKAC